MNSGFVELFFDFSEPIALCVVFVLYFSALGLFFCELVLVLLVLFFEGIVLFLFGFEVLGKGLSELTHELDALVLFFIVEVGSRERFFAEFAVDLDHLAIFY